MALVAGLAEAARDVRSRVGVAAAQIRSELESEGPVRQNSVAVEVPLLPGRHAVLEERQGVRRCRLPAVAEALGKCEIGAVVVRISTEIFEQHNTPVRERTAADVGEWVIRTGG